MKKFLILCFALAFGSVINAKELWNGSVQVNGQQLTAKLFDDPAINPVCRQKFSSAKQAMFYLDGNSFAHGCWISLDGEIHTQITRYDTNETRAYVFSSSIFKSSSVATSNSEPPLKVSAQCKQIYQARVFNYFLESVCKFDAGVAEEMGLASQKICGDSMSEMERKALSSSVQKDVENDIVSMGIIKFCQSNKDGYYQLKPTAENIRTRKDAIVGRPAWCKNSKLPHELAICEDEVLSKNELNNLDLYAEFAKRSGLSTEELRTHRLEFFNKLKSCGANKACIQMRQEERLNWYQKPQNNSKTVQVVAVSRDNIFGEITLYETACAYDKGKSASRFNQAENTRWTGCWIQLGGDVFIHWSIPKSDALYQPGGRVFEYPVHEFIRQ